MTFRGFTQQLAPSQFGPPTGEVAIGAAESQGTAGVAAEADHVHAFPAAPAGDGATTSLPGDTEADGTATTPARSDHRHGREAAAALAAPTAPTLGTVYQNTTGAPLAITLAITITPSSTGAVTVTLGVGTTTTPAAATVAEVAASGPTLTLPLTFIVPPDAYYQLDATTNGGTVTIATVTGATL